MDNSLEQLKDLHLPAEVSVFPLATGWYCLIIFLFAIFAGGLFIFWKRRNNKRQQQNIYKMLGAIESANSSEALTETSILIKRVAIMKFPEQKPQMLFGEQLLLFLDETGKTTEFTTGDGRNLLMIYQKQSIQNPEKFFALIRKWLEAVL